MLTYRSRVPEALDALVQLVQAEFAGDTDTDVHDGQWLAGSTRPKFVCIGWSGFASGYRFASRAMNEQLGPAVVTVSAEQAGLAPSTTEHFAISCAAGTLNGDPGQLPQARRDTLTLVRRCGQLAVQPPYLGGTVERLTFAQDAELSQSQQGRGALVLATFTVGCWSTASQ